MTTIIETTRTVEDSRVLMACPFCGNRSWLSVIGKVDSSAQYAYCSTCGATGPNALDYGEAIQKWNQRITVMQFFIGGE